jgi:hypothetical protein
LRLGGVNVGLGGDVNPLCANTGADGVKYGPAYVCELI